MARPATMTAELRRITAEHGGLLRPEDVVEAARPAASPLHHRFEWDDTEAARQYRLVQAEQLIRVSVIVVGAETPLQTRCFVSLTTDRPHGIYREVISVMQDPDQRSQLLMDAYSEMTRFQKKFAGLQELGAVLHAMQAARPESAGV